MADKETFYQWATNSDATPYWYGELYGNTVPDRDSFFEDWTDEYFSDDSSDKRSYAIGLKTNGEEIGQINYQLEKSEDKTYIEIDIILAKDSHKGKGYGSEAISVLVSHLHKQLPGIPYSIYAIKDNSRAIKAYQKAGFHLKRSFIDKMGKEWVMLTIEG